MTLPRALLTNSRSLMQKSVVIKINFVGASTFNFNLTPLSCGKRNTYTWIRTGIQWWRYIYIRIYHVTQQFQFSLSFHQWRKPLQMCEQLYRILNSSGCFRTRDICVWLQSSVKKIFSDFYFILFYEDKVIKYANHVDPAAKNFHVFETETFAYCHSRTERGRKIR